MKYAEIVALRDNTIRDFLLAKLPIADEQKETLGDFFDKAVKAADEDLKVQLRDLFGKGSRSDFEAQAGSRRIDSLKLPPPSEKMADRQSG